MRWWSRRACMGLLACGCAAVLPRPSRAADPTPPPAEHHLIRLGPEALVFEDERGNVSMVDEDQPSLSRGQALGIVLGALGGGAAALILNEPRAIAVGAAYGADQPTRGGITGARSPVTRPAPTRAPP